MRFNRLRRRDLITLLAGAGASWPLAALAQQPAMPVIGYLDAGAPEPNANLVAAFRKGLSEAGFFEGQNVAIEFRWAHNENARLPELAADLVRHRVAVIATPLNTPASLSANAATTTIPIVFGMGGDPVKFGFVASLNRPGGNLTGVTIMNAELMAKRLGLLQELLPGATLFAVLVNPNSPLITESIITDMRAVAGIGRQIEVLTASTTRDIDTAFASMAQKRASALLINPDTLFRDRREQLVTLAAHHKVPAIYPWREAVEIGGLMSYGSSVAEVSRQVGIYTGRVLKGEKPADLPIMEVTKFELVLNLTTAK